MTHALHEWRCEAEYPVPFPFVVSKRSSRLPREIGSRSSSQIDRTRRYLLLQKEPCNLNGPVQGSVVQRSVSGLVLDGQLSSFAQYVTRGCVEGLLRQLLALSMFGEA